MQQQDAAPQEDVIIVGGGPAGLSAALVLGRCRRKVLVIDKGEPRNAPAKAMHGFLSRDGENPLEMLRIAREQIARYSNVRFRDGHVTHVERGREIFRVRTEQEEEFTSRILLLATGIRDDLPKLKNIGQFWGKSVHLCPYCDGWEHRDAGLAIYGRGQEGADLALEMLGWSRELTLCTDGPAEIDADTVAKLERLGIALIEQPIAQLEGESGQIAGVRFADGAFLECSGMFFASRQYQCSDLARELGCKLDENGAQIEHCDTTSGVSGLYVAGNTCSGLQLVIMAAADGTQAAFKINQALVEKDVEKANSALAESKPVPQPNTIMASSLPAYGFRNRPDPPL